MGICSSDTSKPHQKIPNPQPEVKPKEVDISPSKNIDDEKVQMMRDKRSSRRGSRKGLEGMPEKKELQVKVESNETLSCSNAYVLKGDLVNFSVKGTWRFFENLEFCNEEGHANMQKLENFNIGALLCKDGEEIFQVENNSSRVFKNSGVLNFFPNCGNYIIQPEGHLVVTISPVFEITVTHKLEFFEKIELIDYVLFEVDSCKKMQEFNIYFNKDMDVSVKIRGTWSFFEGQFVDYNGHSEMNEDNDAFNVGQLLGNINTHTFPLKNDMQFKTETSGQLILYPFTGNFIVKPQGKLRVYIKGGQIVENQSEIEGLEDKEIGKNSIKRKLEISFVEQRVSLWAPKGSKISFRTRGKYKLIQTESDYFNEKGEDSLGDHRGFPIGVLLCRITGMKEYFQVKDGSEFINENAGELIFIFNNKDFLFDPSGHVNVYVKGCEEKSITELERLLGWDFDLLDTARNENYLSIEEKSQFFILNKIRSNPPLFAKQYMEHRKNDPGYSRETYDELLNTKPLPLISPSKEVFLAAKDHALDSGVNSLEGHVGSNGSSLTDRLNKYGDFVGKCGENCSYGPNFGLDIVLQLLIDDGVESRGHRKNILDAKFQVAGISIQKHKKYRWNCVHDYASGFNAKK